MRTEAGDHTQPFSRRRLSAAAVLAFAWACAGCGGDDGGDAAPQCVEDLAADCIPAFNPTWDNVYSNVILQSCGGIGSGAACHGPEGRQGGLELSSSAGSLAALLGEVDGEPRVIPGDPACSPLMVRLETDDPALRMPQGAAQPLPAARRCAVQRWIEMGASP